jgi:hypothetical protein
VADLALPQDLGLESARIVPVPGIAVVLLLLEDLDPVDLHDIDLPVGTSPRRAPI